MRAGILVLSPSGCLAFNAPAVRQVVLLYFLVPPRNALTNVNRDDLVPFVLRVLPRLVPSELQRSFALGSDGYPSEACWQYAVSRVFNASLPEGSLSPDVGHEFDSKGRVDFYVNSAYHWGVELTREHDRLQQHFACFLLKNATYNTFRANPNELTAHQVHQDGTYYGMIAQGDIHHWVVLDFCHARPVTWIDDNRVLHIVYNEALDGAAVWQRGQCIREIDFMNSIQAMQRGFSNLAVTPTSPQK